MPLIPILNSQKQSEFSELQESLGYTVKNPVSKNTMFYLIDKTHNLDFRFFLPAFEYVHISEFEF